MDERTPPVRAGAETELYQLRRELRVRLDRQPFSACPPEVLRALIAVFDIAEPVATMPIFSPLKRIGLSIVR